MTSYLIEMVDTEYEKILLKKIESLEQQLKDERERVLKLESKLKIRDFTLKSLDILNTKLCVEITKLRISLRNQKNEGGE